MLPRSLVLLGALAAVLGRPVAADVTWKVADEGPRAPDVGLILGDDTRTLAFSGLDAFEFDGASWHPVELNTAAVVGSAASIFFSGGRFVATAVQNGQLLIFVLKGNDWTQIASGPWTNQPFIKANDRIFVPAESFNNICVTPQTCPTDRGDSHGLISISLVDGSVRQEPPMPSCYGKLFTVTGQLYLIQESPLCGGPSSKEGAGRASASSGLPFFRLDGDHWTSLPAWDLPTYSLLSTPNSLWVVITTGTLDRAVRILTASGLSDAVPLPRTNYIADPIALEWGGQPLMASDETNANIYQLHNGSFVQMTPESPVAAPPDSPRVFVAGSRLFTAADGWNRVHPRSSSIWTETSGITGPPGAKSYRWERRRPSLFEEPALFRRDGAGWTRFAVAAQLRLDLVTVVWKDRPVLLVSRAPVRIPSRRSRSDLGLVAGVAGSIGIRRTDAGFRETIFMSGPPGQVARLRDGGWTIFTASPPPGLYEQGTSRIREANGAIYVIDVVGAATTVSIIESTSERRRPTPVFTDLDPRMNVDDIAAVGGKLYLLVGDGTSGATRLEAAIVTPVTGGYQTLVTERTLED